MRTCEVMPQRLDVLAVLGLVGYTVSFCKALLFAVQRLDEHVVERVFVASCSVDLVHHAARHLARRT